MHCFSHLRFLDENFEQNLATTQRKHDTISFVLQDPMEQAWPAVGQILIEDAETGENAWVNFKNEFQRGLYKESTESRQTELDRLFGKIKMDYVIFQTDQDYVKPLMTFFKVRSRRARK